MTLDYFCLSLSVISVVIISLGFPIAYAMTICAMVFILANGMPISFMVHELALSLNSFTMLSIPLFMFAGKLMTESGIADRIFDFANRVVGKVPGGLGHVNVLSSLIFAGMSGSTLADVAGLGEIEYKAMLHKGYDPNFTMGVTLASAAIGPILPPSLPMVLFGVAADVSITGLFLGGVLPGFLIALSLMIYVYIVGKRRGYYSVWEGWRLLLQAFIKALPPLLTPVIIVGGMAIGMFSPTEAATVSVLYALLITVVVYRELKWPAFIKVIREVAMSSTRLLFVITSAMLFGWVMTVGEIPQQIAHIMNGSIKSPAMFMLVCLIVNLILGAILENAIPLLILAPMLITIAEKQYGFDPVHFGVVMVFNIMIGQFTPPIGLSLFVMRDIAHKPLSQVFYSVAPFLIPLIGSLLIMAYFPWVVTCVPRMFGF